jgi:hypothetical protein
MMAAGLLSAGAFVIVFAALSGVEKLIHRLTKNPDQSYKLGVWIFSVLAAVYAFLTSLGR